ncbi:MAG: BtrH N-terminal domain-containing protein, partial [Bacteroidota bacterium]
FAFPTFIVRNKPGQMRTNIEKRLGVRFKTYDFKDSLKGQQALDRLLQQNIPTGAQVDFFYMDYVPSWERVHINVHFLVVTGKEENNYLISDTYFPGMVKLDSASLEKGRFAGGNMSPRGFLFHVDRIPAEIDYNRAIIKGIRKACFYMLKIPIPFLGIRGMHMFARKVVEWPRFARDTEHLSHEIMKINILLEDQGTGGAGFRFMYATFLQQAAGMINRPELKELSGELMKIGDGWREISLFSARIGKNRDLGPEKLKQLSEMIHDRAEVEERFFKSLSKAIK